MVTALAIDGGHPVRETFLPYGRHTVTDSDIQAVTKVLNSDFLTTGPAVNSFEETLTGTVGAKHAVAVSSGTAALHTMYSSVGISPGDEVIVPIITFAATANAVLYLRARPVFADVDPQTLLIDSKSVERLITDSTKAVVGVDFAGQPADYEKLYELSSDRKISVLADAAHSLGSSRDGVRAGAMADASILSFHPVKHVAAGEGGAVLTDDPNLAEKAVHFRNHGISTDHIGRMAKGTWKYEVNELGYNYRISDIHSALAESQIARLSKNILNRQNIAAIYESEFKSVDGVNPLAVGNRNEHAYHLYIVKIDPSVFSVARSKFFEALRAENIGVNVHYIPVGWHPIYTRLGFKRVSCPNGEDAYKQILTLPLWPSMSGQDVADVVTAVKKVAQAYKR